MTYANEDSRIRIVDKENGGLSDARNVGLGHANGDYIHFFDSDDTIESDFYEETVKSIGKEYDLVVTGYRTDRLDNLGRLKSHVLCNGVDAEFPFVSSDSQIDAVRPFLNFAWNKLFRHNFLVKHGLEFRKGLSQVEDCEFFSRVLQYSPAIKFIPYAGYHYMVRPRQTLSNSFDEKILDNILTRLDSSKGIYEQLGCSPQTLCKELSQCANTCFRSYLHQLFRNRKTCSIKVLWAGTKALVNDERIREYCIRYASGGDFICKCVIKECPHLLFVMYYFKSFLAR